MKKNNKKATPKKTVPAVAPKTVKTRTPLFLNPDGTISSSYADAIAWDKDKPNS